LDEIKAYSVLDSTSVRPYNQTLLDMYSDGKPLGFGIGVGGERWKEQRKFAAKVLNELSERRKGSTFSIINFQNNFLVVTAISLLFFGCRISVFYLKNAKQIIIFRSLIEFL
jgi:hypothetical protein